MRDSIIAAAVLAACLFSTGARAQETAPADAGTQAVSPQQPATPPKITLQLERGYRLRAANRNPEALAVFTAVLAADPHNHAALVELGYIHADLRQWASAAKFLGEASEQEPSDMRLHMDLGYALQGLKRDDAASAQFGVVAKEPGEFQDQAQKALDGQKDAAGASGVAESQRALQEGYDALQRGDNAGARRRFEAIVKADPKNVPALKQLGFIYLDEGRTEAAARSFAAARAIDPADALIALQLGYAYQTLQRDDAARDAFTAAAASTDPKIRDAAEAELKSSQEADAPSSAAPPL